MSPTFYGTLCGAAVDVRAEADLGLYGSAVRRTPRGVTEPFPIIVDHQSGEYGRMAAPVSGV